MKHGVWGIRREYSVLVWLLSAGGDTNLPVCDSIACPNSIRADLYEDIFMVSVGGSQCLAAGFVMNRVFNGLCSAQHGTHQVMCLPALHHTHSTPWSCW